MKRKVRKTREEKAITLIALIITIVVLLILAVVAINAVTGDGIIQHATNAKTDYEKAQAEENKTLSYYEAYLNANGQVGKWTQKEATKTVTDLEGNKVEVKVPEGTITKVNSDGTMQEIKLGAYVNYNPIAGLTEQEITDLTVYTSSKDVTKAGEDQTFTASAYNTAGGKWKVLGIENGKILLVSAQNIDNNTGKYKIGYAYTYINGKEELNEICARYGHGKGAASARSMTIEDINKITGYNPELLKFNGNDIQGRDGVEITYKLDGTEIKYKLKNTQYESIGKDFLWHIDGENWHRELTENEVITYTTDYYEYSGVYKRDGLVHMNMNENTDIYNLIFINDKYWLASKCMANVKLDTDTEELGYYRLGFGLRHVSTGGEVSSALQSGESIYIQERGVRAVIVLDANTELKLTSDGSYDINV